VARTNYLQKTVSGRPLESAVAATIAILRFRRKENTTARSLVKLRRLATMYPSLYFGRSWSSLGRFMYSGKLSGSTRLASSGLNAAGLLGRRIRNRALAAGRLTSESILLSRRNWSARRSSSTQRSGGTLTCHTILHPMLRGRRPWKDDDDGGVGRERDYLVIVSRSCT